MNIFNDVLTNKVNLANLAGLSSATIIKNVETLSIFFETAQPVLTGFIAISVITYNLINIVKKLKDKNDEK